MIKTQPSYGVAECAGCKLQVAILCYTEDETRIRFNFIYNLLPKLPNICNTCAYFTCDDCIDRNEMVQCLCDGKLTSYSEYYANSSKVEAKLNKLT